MKCYEYFNCNQKECIARFDDRHCWQVENTLCYKNVENCSDKSKYIKFTKSVCDNCKFRKKIFKIDD